MLKALSLAATISASQAVLLQDDNETADAAPADVPAGPPAGTFAGPPADFPAGPPADPFAGVSDELKEKMKTAKANWDLDGDGNVTPGDMILKIFGFAADNNYTPTAADLENIFDKGMKVIGQSDHPEPGQAAKSPEERINEAFSTFKGFRESIEKGEHAEETAEMKGKFSAGDVAMRIYESGYSPKPSEVNGAVMHFGMKTQGKMFMDEAVDGEAIAVVKADLKAAIACFRDRAADATKDCSQFEGPTGPPDMGGHPGNDPCQHHCFHNGEENMALCGAAFDNEGACRDAGEDKCHWVPGPQCGANGPQSCEPACWANGSENEALCQSDTMRTNEASCRAEFVNCHWNECMGPPAGPPPPMNMDHNATTAGGPPPPAAAAAE